MLKSAILKSYSGKNKNASLLGIKAPSYNSFSEEWEGTNVLSEMINRRKAIGFSKNPTDVRPYLVTSLVKNSLNPVFRKGIFTKELGLTMRDIMKTNTGKNYISQFMKKDDMFYGYKARYNGKYSDVVLNIVQYELENEYKKYEGAIGFSSYEGTVKLSESNGKLMINIYTNQSNVESIAHELFVHNAGEIEEIIQGFRRGGLEEAKKVQKYSADDDHIALRDLDSKHKGVKMYKTLSEELEEVNPKYKKIFDQIENTNLSKYRGLK
jgi:hypothetical protein